ncbi:MAG: hypothetical protein SFZ23_08485 [Planctomycetota bacterium]|nr:hypothetical protein [Planctomycetota bacterium]
MPDRLHHDAHQQSGDDLLQLADDPDSSQAPPRARIFIVTGSGIDAERCARPLAYTLLEEIERVVRSTIDDEGQTPSVAASVCADLWAVGMRWPMGAALIAIGPPSQNAVSAFLANRLPSVSTESRRYAVLMEPMLDGPHVCCYGEDAATTADAVRCFRDRHLPGFVESVLRTQ